MLFEARARKRHPQRRREQESRPQLGDDERAEVRERREAGSRERGDERAGLGQQLSRDRKDQQAQRREDQGLRDDHGHRVVDAEEAIDRGDEDRDIPAFESPRARTSDSRDSE